MVPSPRGNLLLSLLPFMAQGDAKFQGKVHYCAQFAAEKEIDRVREDLNNAKLESQNMERLLKEQNEAISELRRQLVERDVLLNDFMKSILRRGRREFY